MPNWRLYLNVYYHVTVTVVKVTVSVWSLIMVTRRTTKLINVQINERKCEQMPLKIMYKKLVNFFKKRHVQTECREETWKKPDREKISSDSQRFFPLLLGGTERLRSTLMAKLRPGANFRAAHSGSKWYWVCQDVNKTVERVRLNSC